ncbi:hypothetical protein [Streptomyces sp. SJL17-4]
MRVPVWSALSERAEPLGDRRWRGRFFSGGRGHGFDDRSRY